VTVNGTQVTVTPTDETGRTFDIQTYTFSGGGGGGGGTDTTPPTTPANLTAAAITANRIDLAWSASTDNVGVAGYTVTRDGMPLATVAPTATSYSDTAVAPGSTHTYTVSAFDAAGNTSPPSTSATATTPPLAAGTSLALTPTDDAYIDASAPSSNFGTATRIIVGNSPADDGLLRFSVATGGCTITKATLSLTVGKGHNDGSVQGGDVHTTTNSNWSESNVTWTNAPPANATTLATFGTVSPGTTYTVDITPAVPGDGIVSLRISTSSSDAARYLSKEAGSTPPTLTVTCG